MTYTNVFGGENVNPADLSYKLYDFATAELLAVVDLDLRWQFEALDGSHIVADKIDVLPTLTAGHSMTMPDATLVSVGEDVLWNNVGATTFTVRDYGGTALCTVLPGTQWYTYLIDNGTPSGLWRAVQFGAVTSSANASALAGYGLRATETARLDQNLLTIGVSGAISLDASSRAQVFRNTGGVATWTIAPAANLGPPPNANNGWFIIAINNGGGNVTLDPNGSELIDGAATKVLGPGESCVVYCFGSGFATMGYGRALSTNVTGISIDASGTGDLTLNAAQVAAQVQDFNGTVTAPRTIIYGPGTGYWFIFNNTNAPLQFKGASSDATISTVAASAFSIVRSQNGAMDIAFTATSGTVTSITGVSDQIVTVPNPLVATGTIDLSVIAGLTPGNYGGGPTPTKVPVLNIDNRGRIRTAAQTDITINQGQIADLPTLLEFLIPPGVMLPFAGKTLPPVVPPTTLFAWLPCDGTTRNKSDYPRLYAAIGTTYGPATGVDPAGTFTLPDTRGCVLMGQDPVGIRTTVTWYPGGDPAVVGSHGGTQAVQYAIPQLFTRTGAWGGQPFTGGTTGQQSVNFSGATGGPYDGGTPVTGGGGGAANAYHQHPFNVSVMTGGEGLTLVNFGAYGYTDANASDWRTNVQPTLVVRHIIKT